jgi:hypothetical protein
MLLKALFEGNIYPAETVVCKNKTFQDAKKSANEAVCYFEQILSKQDYARLDSLLDDLALSHAEENGEHFKYGFVLGMRLMQEIYAYPLITDAK